MAYDDYDRRYDTPTEAVEARLWVMEVSLPWDSERNSSKHRILTNIVDLEEAALLGARLCDHGVTTQFQVRKAAIDKPVPQTELDLHDLLVDALRWREQEHETTIAVSRLGS